MILHSGKFDKDILTLSFQGIKDNEIIKKIKKIKQLHILNKEEKYYLIDLKTNI